MFSSLVLFNKKKKCVVLRAIIAEKIQRALLSPKIIGWHTLQFVLFFYVYEMIRFFGIKKKSAEELITFPKNLPTLMASSWFWRFHYLAAVARDWKWYFQPRQLRNCFSKTTIIYEDCPFNATIEAGIISERFEPDDFWQTGEMINLVTLKMEVYRHEMR